MQITPEQLTKIGSLKLSAREAQTLTMLTLMSIDDGRTAAFDHKEVCAWTGQAPQALSKILAQLAAKRIITRASKNRVVFNF